MTGAFLVANAALMVHYSAALRAGALAVVALAIAASAALGLARMRIGARIEALDGRLAAFTYELFAGISKLRASAAEDRAFELDALVLQRLQLLGRLTLRELIDAVPTAAERMRIMAIAYVLWRCGVLRLAA